MKSATKQNTVAPVEAPPRVVATPIAPEYIRLPKPGNLCPHSGLSRSYINSLVLPTEANKFKPPVKSVSLRGEGQTKGVRLIVFRSLMEYLKAREVTP